MGRWLPQQSLLRHLLLAALGGLLVYAVTYVTGDFRDVQIATGAYYLIALAGLTVLTGSNGQISLGHGGLLAVGAFTAALLTVHAHLPLLVVLLLAMGVTGVVGALLGVAAARLRGPYLAGATLAFAVALPGLFSHYRQTFGSDTGLTGPAAAPPAFLGAGFSIPHWQAWSCSLAALLVLVLLANLQRSGVGRAWRAVRDDEVSASLAGLHVARWQVLAFVVSAACAGLAGGLLAEVVGQVVSGAFTLTLSLSLLTGVVLGGLGSLIGALWGAFALVFLPTWASNVSQSLHASTAVSQNLAPAIYGLVLIAVILLAPGGISGALRRIGHTLLTVATSRRNA